MASAAPVSNSLRTFLLLIMWKMSDAVNTIFLSSFSTMDSMPHFRKVVQGSFDIKHLVSIHCELTNSSVSLIFTPLTRSFTGESASVLSAFHNTWRLYYSSMSDISIVNWKKNETSSMNYHLSSQFNKRPLEPSSNMNSRLIIIALIGFVYLFRDGNVFSFKTNALLQANV